MSMTKLFIVFLSFSINIIIFRQYGEMTIQVQSLSIVATFFSFIPATPPYPYIHSVGQCRIISRIESPVSQYDQQLNRWTEWKTAVILTGASESCASIISRFRSSLSMLEGIPQSLTNNTPLRGITPLLALTT